MWASDCKDTSPSIISIINSPPFVSLTVRSTHTDMSLCTLRHASLGSMGPPGENCPHVPTCALYPRFSLKGALRIWKEHFCEHPEKHLTCARFRLNETGQPVPETLLPNGEHIGG